MSLNCRLFVGKEVMQNMRIYERKKNTSRMPEKNWRRIYGKSRSNKSGFYRRRKHCIS